MSTHPQLLSLEELQYVRLGAFVREVAQVDCVGGARGEPTHINICGSGCPGGTRKFAAIKVGAAFGGMHFRPLGGDI